MMQKQIMAIRSWIIEGYVNPTNKTLVYRNIETGCLFEVQRYQFFTNQKYEKYFKGLELIGFKYGRFPAAERGVSPDQMFPVEEMEDEAENWKLEAPSNQPDTLTRILDVFTGKQHHGYFNNSLRTLVYSNEDTHTTLEIPRQTFIPDEQMGMFEGYNLVGYRPSPCETDKDPEKVYLYEEQ